MSAGLFSLEEQNIDLVHSLIRSIQHINSYSTDI